MRNIRAPGALWSVEGAAGHTATDTAIDTASWYSTGLPPNYRRPFPPNPRVTLAISFAQSTEKGRSTIRYEK